uniref:non-specific serine/threonine protein kinase n=1 Tax=Mola mola TaxID=94237 RepID=A0A3Q3WI78_MOLML
MCNKYFIRNLFFFFYSSTFFNGAPLSELSWPSSLAVVAVSFSGLFTFIFLMLACLCCKKGEIGFKEFENTEGEEYQADLSALASPSSQHGPEVYILPLTEVSLPVSKQPGRSIQLLKSTDLGHHSLLYLKEIGHGWFGKVLLGEVSAGLSTTQVVVKELKASASVQDQMQFLEEVQPYRTLQHPAVLQCLAQCSEVTPYLLVMEFCPLGDLKSYLHSCRVADCETPDPLILQRMACDISSGLLQLHKYNFIHSDLALRNCLLTSEMSVKIGDYGLSHGRYKDDYYVTQDQIWVPLRWIAPELIDEVHGNLLVVDQTKSSNIWALGVTMWELFELGDQPYRHYSDRQVLTYAVKEQQLKLPKPQLHFPLAERWYEVMQFCWLQPELRPSSEEVHLLVTYLCAKGSSEAEEDFEQRWNALRPNLLSSTSHTLASSASSSFPLLEHFSDSLHSDTGDDLLTVTETSHGLNFEYKWEQGRAEQPYCASSTSGPLGVVPVLSAHSPSVSSEYYIRIEEPVECNINSLNESVVDYSPGLEANSSRLSSTCHSVVNHSCHNIMVPFRKTLPIANHISTVGTDDGLLVGQRREGDMEDDIFAEREATNWTLNHSANNNSLSFDSRHKGSGHNSYLDHQYADHYNTTESWSLTKATTRTFHSSSSVGTLETDGDSQCIATNKSIEFGTNIHFYHKERGEFSIQVERKFISDNVRNIDSLTSLSVNARDKEGEKIEGKYDTQLLLKGDRSYSEPKIVPEASSIKSPSSVKQPQTGQTVSVGLVDKRLSNSASSAHIRALDSGDDDDDITDITSGILVDFNLDYAEVEEEELSPLRNPKRTPDSVDTRNLSSSMASTSDQAFSPDPYNTVVLPKSLDSGYDTENNESPEFIFKELTDPCGVERSPRLGGEPKLVLQVGLGQGVCTSTSTSELQLKSLIDKNPYRDSAYFSDYDAEKERSPQEEWSNFYEGPIDREFTADKFRSARHYDSVKRPLNNQDHLTNLRHIKSCVLVNLSEADTGSSHPLSTPGLSMLSPFPPQMGGCLTKESAPADDDLGLETEHSGEEPSSELSSSNGPEPCSTVQEASRNNDDRNGRPDDCSLVQCLHSDSTITDYRDEAPDKKENGDASTEEEELPEFRHVKEETEDKRNAVRINEEDFEDIDAEECDSQDSLCEELNGPMDLSSSSSLLELCGEQVRAPLEEAEDEDDSDESESDEELRTYNIQDEDSEESEEDNTTVPVVVSDCSRAKHLRSLLKMPTLLTQSFCDELERKKKAVSFFDDVTVFLFDQPHLSSPDTITEDHTSPTSTSNSLEAPKPTALALNRFMVSRFSITHVSDPHTSSATGLY